MSKGRIAQWDTPYNLHHHPADAFVRDFIRSEALEEQREQVFARAAERNAGGQDQGRAAPRGGAAIGRRHFRPGVNPPTATFCDKALKASCWLRVSFPPLPASSHTA